MTFCCVNSVVNLFIQKWRSLRTINNNNYFPGDTRNSLTLHISLMNVIMLREHNRIARALSQLNPHWDDERIFQTARTIHIGVFQHICLAELVSAMLGEDILHRHGLLHRTDDFVDEYDVDSDPGPLQEFTHASFRQPHSMVNGPIMWVKISYWVLLLESNWHLWYKLQNQSGLS